jgi:hypothetical protein
MNDGYAAASTALNEWLHDRPSHHYLTELDRDDLEDAAVHLLIQLAALMCRIYGSQPEAAARHDYARLIGGLDAILLIDGPDVAPE